MGCCQSKVSNEPTIRYEVTVKTADDYMDAGTDATVYIMLVGEDGKCTEKKKLDNFLRNDHERGQVDHFRIQARDVGPPCIIRISLEGFLKEDEWLCETITVHYKGEEVCFVVQDWIEGDREFARGTAELTHKIKNRYIRSLRQREIERNKVNFDWAETPVEGTVGWGLPRYGKWESYTKLPKIFKFEQARLKHLVFQGIGAGMGAVLNLLGDFSQPIKDFESFKRLYSHNKLRRTEVPNYLEGWETDEGMGRQTLNGVSPIHFKRCCELPSGFDVTNDDVAQFLREGKTLESEMQIGRVYIGDYSKMMNGIKRNAHPKTKERFHCCSAVALFYVRSDGKIVPIAIQLVPGDRDYLFTPADSKADWMLAKIYFRSTQSNAHQWQYHFLYCHAVMETFAVSMFRCFPSSHPLYKLLRPHLQTVPTINTDARNTLLTHDAMANQALALSGVSSVQKWYKTFRLENLNIPKLLKKQGTDNRDLLPEYHYRDDALRLWNIMEHYVGSVIRFYYKSDQDVVQDTELQAWTNDVAVEGFGWLDGDCKGMTKSITTISQLIEICTIVIYTSSVQHAAVNFGQFANYRFVPNAPLAMRMCPHKKGEANMKRIIDSLPDITMASISVALGFTLSSFTPNDVFLGDYRKKFFTEAPVLEMQKEYRQSLEALEKRLEERNCEMEHPYTFLLPSRVPNYIAI